MLVAPLSLPPTGPHLRRRARTSVSSDRATQVLAAWLVAGLASLALVPALRGGATFGTSGPFWLVVAPAIDLAWLARARIAAAIRRGIRGLRRTPRAQARRQRRSRTRVHGEGALIRASIATRDPGRLD